jgi:hypothetical protein
VFAESGYFVETWVNSLRSVGTRASFKHALLQDAAYDSLLRARRPELHGKIARAIEGRFPGTEATEPELLAHHYTEAMQPGKAIPLWHQAGSLALKRMALTEAIAHLNKGLELVAALPPSAERDGKELDLRTLLGTAWIAFKGWPAQEVWDSLHPALALARSLRRNDSAEKTKPDVFESWFIISARFHAALRGRALARGPHAPGC